MWNGIQSLTFWKLKNHLIFDKKKPNNVVSYKILMHLYIWKQYAFEYGPRLNLLTCLVSFKQKQQLTYLTLFNPKTEVELILIPWCENANQVSSNAMNIFQYQFSYLHFNSKIEFKEEIFQKY